MIISNAVTRGGNLRRSRAYCFTTTSLSSIALVAVLLHAPAVLAADFQPAFNNNPNTATLVADTTAASATDNVIIKMLGGDDTYNIDANLTGFQNMTFSGGSETDALNILAGGRVGITGTSSINSTETVSNAGVFSTGTLNYKGTAGKDEFGNSGKLNVLGNGTFAFGDANDTFLNDGEVRVTGNAVFNGGAGGADEFINNTGKTLTLGGPAQILGFERLTNEGTIKATGGLTYTGSANADRFINAAGGEITVSGNDVLFDGRGGSNDVFSNLGTLTVNGAGNGMAVRNFERVSNTGTLTGAGAGLFDGGPGGVEFDNSGTMTLSGLLTIRKFGTTSNSGTINANGGLDVSATAGADSFNNDAAGVINVTGDASFDLGAGNDSFVNANDIAISGAGSFDGGDGNRDTFSNGAGAAITVGGLTSIKGFEEVTNNGTINADGGLTFAGTGVGDSFTNGAGGFVLVTGGGSFTFGAGQDTLTNSGAIKISGDGKFTFGGSNDLLLNEGRIVVGGTAELSGGLGGADTLTNAAGGTVLITGAATISGFERFTNEGDIRARGGLAYTGGGNADRVINGPDGVITVSGGGATFDGRGGTSDLFNNLGTLAVNGSTNDVTVENFERVSNAGTLTSGGAGLFDGGTGGVFFDNSGTLTTGGSLTIGNFVTTSNTGTVTASGGLNVTSTGGNDSFTNGDEAADRLTVSGGNARFDGLGGTDTFNNVGILETLGGSDALTVQNFETVTNSGSVDGGGIVVVDGGAAGVSFDNTGTVSSGDNLTVRNFASLVNTGGIGSSRAGLFDGGVAGAQFDNSGTIEITNKLTIRNFVNIGNSGAITANGGLALAGTAAAGTFTNAAAGSIDVTGGDAIFDGLGGVDVFDNLGQIATTDGGNDVIVRNFETVANAGTLTSSGAGMFDAGAGGLQFNNTGVVDADGKVTVRNFAAVENFNGIIAGGGLAQTGTAAAGSFTNGNDAGDSILVSGGNASFDGLGGIDTFTNNGTLETAGDGNAINVRNYEIFTNDGAVISAGGAIFDGGAGGQLFSNGGTLAAAGNLTIRNFLNATNTGTITTDGGLTFSGSGAGNIFTNGTGAADRVRVTGGDAVFDGLGGNDTFNNVGILETLAPGDDVRIASFEAVTNSGTMNIGGRLIQTGAASDTFTNSGTVNLVGNGIISGDLTNSGLFDLSAGAGPTIGQIVSVRGDFDAAGGRVGIETDLAGADGQGLTDRITVAGTAAGVLNLDIDYQTGGNRLVYDNDLSVVSSGGGAFTQVTLQDAGGNNLTLANNTSRIIDSFGLIDYNIHNENGDVFVRTDLDEVEAAGIAGGLSSTISAISAIFHKPASAFLSNCKPGNDGTAFGTWARAAGGSVDTSISGSDSLGGNTGSDNSTDFFGLQGGLDFAACDVGGSNTVIHTGLTVGHMNGTSTQTNGGFGAGFNSYFVGAYGAMIVNNRFTADALIRYDSHQFDLSHDDAEIILPGTTTDGSTLSATASASYIFLLGDNVQFRPVAGVTFANTEVDAFNVNGTAGTLEMDDLFSVMGFAGATLQYTHRVNDSLVLLPFIQGNVYNEFGEGGSATLDLGRRVSIETGTVGTFGQIGAGVNIFVPGGTGETEPNLVGGLRLDGQFGDGLEGWALTGNVRLQF